MSILLAIKYQTDIKLTYFIYHLYNKTDLIKTCVFWNTKENRWDTDGCKLLDEKSNDELIVCSCSHLTNFALIMGDSLEDDNLGLLSKILGGISCGLLFITLFCKMVIR